MNREIEYIQRRYLVLNYSLEEDLDYFKKILNQIKNFAIIKVPGKFKISIVDIKETTTYFFFEETFENEQELQLYIQNLVESSQKKLKEYKDNKNDIIKEGKIIVEKKEAVASI